MPRRALIVDEDPAASEVMRDVLNSAGMSALVLAKSGDAAQYLYNEKFALLLFALRMQAPDGSELAAVARDSENNQMTPVIMVSDENTPEVSERYAGAFFLRKPVDRSQLLKVLKATQGVVEHEKRLFRRVTLRSKVHLAFEQQEWEGETVDVSLSGLLVKGPSRIPAGTPVNVRLSLPGESQPVVGAGRITRVQGQDLMGIYLNRLTMAESARLQDFLLPLILREAPEANAVRR